MTTLHVQVPDTYVPERHYILGVLLRDFLGFDFTLQPAPCRETTLRVAADPSGSRLILPDSLFQTPEEDWLTERSLPKPAPFTVHAGRVFPEARLTSPEVPILFPPFPAEGALFSSTPSGEATLSLDILGMSFFMISRYEEYVRKSSRLISATPYGNLPPPTLLTRPIVNEYLEILWAALSRLWPRLQRAKRTYRFVLTHDVDHPFGTIAHNFVAVTKSVAGDILKRRDAQLAKRRFVSYLRTRRDNEQHDLYNTFDLLMDVSERHGIKSAFYFIPRHTGGFRDGTYGINHPRIRRILRKIHGRGHEIGLHASYNSFRSEARIRAEFNALRNACEEEGIRQSHWGGRQHYLNWENPASWRAWEAAGLSYDSTLSFVESPGFRAGTCYEYPAFDLGYRRVMKLTERPLVAMEMSLLEVRGMNSADAAREIRDLRLKTKLFDGDFTLLWHNSRLSSQKELACFDAVMNH